MNTISDKKDISNNGQHFKTEFVLTDSPVYLANTLRRSFSSLIPTISFDDTYYDNIESRSIRIHKNTSALHNEFLSHRLSYVPINSTNRDYFNIKSEFNLDGVRTFKFPKTDPKLIFKLNIKNNKDMSASRDKLGLLNVKTSNFTIISDDLVDIPNDKFFSPDVFTGDYIILDKLKQDLGNEDGGEELEIDCIPRISMGCKNTRNDPTGTVTYEMMVDDSRTEEVFTHKKEYLNAERLKKGLPGFTDEEEQQLRTSFNLLDIDRVIQTDSHGNPNKFKFSVESIGFMDPDSIINNGLGMVLITLKDIQNSMTFDIPNYEFTMNDKIEMNLLDADNVNNGWMIKIINENHTIGNFLSNMIRNIWCDKGVFLDFPVLKIASYKMQHPTIEEIEFMMVPNNNTNLKKIEFIRRILTPSMPSVHSDKLNKLSDDNINKLLCAVIFQKTLNIAIEMLLNIKHKSFLKDIPLTFDVIDNDEWMEKNIDITGSINTPGEQLILIHSFKETMNILEDKPESPRFPVTPEASKEAYQDESLSVASDDIILETVDDGSVEEESVIPGISKTLYEDSLDRYRLTYVSTGPFDSILKTMYTNLQDKKDYKKLEITPKDFADIINIISDPKITPEDDSNRDIPVSEYTDEQGNNKTRVLKLDYTNGKKHTFVDRKIVKK